MKKFLNLTALLTMFAALSFGIMSCDDGDFTSFIGGKDSAVNPSNTFTVTFNVNGGTGEMEPKTFSEGVPTALPACTFTAPTGKEFLGWSETSTATEATYEDKQTISVTRNMNLYAIYSAAGETKYTVMHFKQAEKGKDLWIEVQDDRQIKTGKAGTLTNAAAKDYGSNYKCQGVNQDTIREDGTTVIVIKYEVLSDTSIDGNRISIEIAANSDLGVKMSVLQNSDNVKITADSGYTDYMWYVDSKQDTTDVAPTGTELSLFNTLKTKNAGDVVEVVVTAKTAAVTVNGASLTRSAHIYVTKK